MKTDKIDDFDFLRGHSPSEVTCLEVKDESLRLEGLPRGRRLFCLAASQAQPGDRVVLSCDGNYYYRIYRPSGSFAQFDHVLNYSPPLYFEVGRFTIEYVVVN